MMQILVLASYTCDMTPSLHGFLHQKKTREKWGFHLDVLLPRKTDTCDLGNIVFCLPCFRYGDLNGNTTCTDAIHLMIHKLFWYIRPARPVLICEFTVLPLHHAAL